MSGGEKPVPGSGEPEEAAASRADGFMPIEEGVDAAAQADELLMHGLLSVLHERAGGAGERRVARVLDELREFDALGEFDAMREPGRTAAAAGTLARGSRRAGRRLRRMVGVPALALAIVLGSWVMLEWPGHQAKAAVMASVSAVNGPGNRRYEVRLMRGADTKLPEKPEAIFDNHDGGNYLLRAHNPFGGVVIAGQDAAGEWAIRREGGIERAQPRAAWPRWSTDRGESLLAEPVGTLMKSLAGDYRLSDQGVSSVEGKRLRHIAAVRRRGTPPHLADRVEIWIDADSQLLERMEMNWDRPAGPGPGPGGPGTGFGAGPGPRGGRPPLDDRGGRVLNEPAGEGQVHDGLVGDGPGRDGPRPSGEGVRSPGRDGQGPMGLALDRPPPGPRGDGPREGPRPDGPDAGGPRGPGGPGGPGGGRGPGPGPGPGPGKMIRQLVIQRVEAPAWSAEWFTPEGHLDGKWGEAE